MPDNINMAQKIKKADLVKQIFLNTNLPEKDISRVIDSFFEEVKASLCAGSVIELRNFGTFEPRLRKGRHNAVNPRTGEKSDVAPHYVAAFRPGKELKELICKLKV